MSETPPPPPDLKAPIALWRIARALLCTLHQLFGPPDYTAACGALTRKNHDLMSSWLRCAEAMLRRLLMIEAAALPTPPPTRGRPGGGPQAGRTPTVRNRPILVPVNPETWRVSLNCTGPMDRRRPRRPAPAHAGVTPALHALPSAWPLALRHQALLNVFNNPQPYARRLARRLHARPQLVEIVLRAPPEYINRVDHAEEITNAAIAAWAPATPDSS